jgi:preprotein translocase subunit SecE
MAVTARRRSGTPEPQFGVIRFFREVFDELRKVAWPTPAELYRYTLIVLVTVVVLAAFIGGVDYALREITRRFVYAAVTKG